MARLAKIHVLLLDDCLLASMTDVERRDLLEVLEDRNRSLIDGHHLPAADQNLASATGEAAIADAICDGLVHNAHVVTLRGCSMRKEEGHPEATETTNWMPAASRRSSSDRTPPRPLGTGTREAPESLGIADIPTVRARPSRGHRT